MLVSVCLFLIMNTSFFSIFCVIISLSSDNPFFFTLFSLSLSLSLSTMRFLLVSSSLRFLSTSFIVSCYIFIPIFFHISRCGLSFFPPIDLTSNYFSAFPHLTPSHWCRFPANGSWGRACRVDSGQIRAWYVNNHW